MKITLIAVSSTGLDLQNETFTLNVNEEIPVKSWRINTIQNQPFLRKLLIQPSGMNQGGGV